MTRSNFIRSATLPLAALLAACSANIGGVGNLSDGEAVIGNMEAGGSQVAIQITSPKGWTCESIWTDQKAQKTSVTLPMTCPDGRTGTMILTMNDAAKTMFGTFSLSDGRTGQVSFPFARS